MPTLLAQIAPQRSTQYSALATALAPSELTLSALGAHIRVQHLVTLGGQNFVECELDTWPSDVSWRDLGLPAMTSAFFEARMIDGAMWLRPVDLPFQPALGLDLMMTRRYKGKTNEAFTHFMLNLARFSSAFRREPWSSLRVFDPLSGGGTTLFAALALGAHAAGVEQNKEDVESTAAFVAQYCREQGMVFEEREERLKKYGRRWCFILGSAKQHCILARGDTSASAGLMAGVKSPHLIVADLPYGIQHPGELAQLLTEAFPVWASMLTQGGAMVLAWDSTRFGRTDMLAMLSALVPNTSALTPLTCSPYDQLAHRVDRVIKQRDVVVVAQPASPPSAAGTMPVEQGAHS